MTKENKNYWFKRKKYGYGWNPSTKQGWIALGVYLVFIALGTLILINAPKNQFSIQVALYLLYIFITTIVFLYVTYLHAPSPKWRWGTTENDKSLEDE